MFVVPELVVVEEVGALLVLLSFVVVEDDLLLVVGVLLLVASLLLAFPRNVANRCSLLFPLLLVVVPADVEGETILGNKDGSINCFILIVYFSVVLLLPASPHK